MSFLGPFLITTAAGGPLRGYTLPAGPLWQDTAATTPATANNAAVARIDSSSGAASLLQADATARPLLQTATNGLLFDGVNDHLVFTGSFSELIGAVWCVFRTGATAFPTRGRQVLVSTANAAVADTWLELGITDQGKLYIERSVAGVKRCIIGSSQILNSTGYAAYIAWNGTDYYMQIGPTEQNPQVALAADVPGGWFGSIAATSNVVMGATVTSAGPQRPFQGQLHDLKFYASDLTLP